MTVGFGIAPNLLTPASRALAGLCCAKGTAITAGEELHLALRTHAGEKLRPGDSIRGWQARTGKGSLRSRTLKAIVAKSLLQNGKSFCEIKG